MKKDIEITTTEKILEEAMKMRVAEEMYKSYANYVNENNLPIKLK